MQGEHLHFSAVQRHRLRGLQRLHDCVHLVQHWSQQRQAGLGKDMVGCAEEDHSGPPCRVMQTEDAQLTRKSHFAATQPCLMILQASSSQYMLCRNITLEKDKLTRKKSNCYLA